MKPTADISAAYFRKSDVSVALWFAAIVCQLPEQLLQGMQTKGRRFAGGRYTLVEDDFCII